MTTMALSRKVAVAAQAIQDSSYEALSPGRFRAELLKVHRAALYKSGGFFLFSNIKPGSYTLRVSGDEFRTQLYPLVLPMAPGLLDSPPSSPFVPLFGVPGDNELAVVVRNVNPVTRRVLFDPVALAQPIYAGAPAKSTSLSTILTEQLDAGKVTGAKLASVAGLAPESILRLVRASSIRLRFDPYHQFPTAITRVVGRISLAEDPSVALAAARIRLLQVNGVAISLDTIADADIANVQIAGRRMILGSAADVVTESNASGDYILYFPTDGFFQSLAVEASLAGYQTASAGTLIQPGERRRIDFQMIPI